MTETQKGNTYLISQAIIWSLFPIITIIGLKGIPSMVALFWATLFSALFFLLIITLRKKWQELKNLQVWKYSLGVAIFIGVIYYGLYFYGLTKTTPVNAAIIGLFEVATSYLFFQIIHKEHISKKHLIGVILATMGTLLIFLPKFGHFYPGDIFILLATFFAPLGNWYQQKVRKIASAETLMFTRNILTIPFLFILVLLINGPILSLPTGVTFWYLLLNGAIILGFSKILWIEGIHRINVTKALATSSMSPFFTIVFAWILLAQAPNYIQLLSLPLLVAGIFLLTNVNFNSFNFLNKKKLS